MFISAVAWPHLQNKSFKEYGVSPKRAWYASHSAVILMRPPLSKRSWGISTAGSAPVAALPPPTTKAVVVSAAPGLTIPPAATSLLLSLMRLLVFTTGLLSLTSMPVLVVELTVGRSTDGAGGPAPPPVGDKAAFASAVADTAAGPLGSFEQQKTFRVKHLRKKHSRKTKRKNERYPFFL